LPATLLGRLSALLSAGCGLVLRRHLLLVFEDMTPHHAMRIALLQNRHVLLDVLAVIIGWCNWQIKTLGQ
jgi:hypothetical protein